MPFCTNCGQGIDEKSKFCPNCGTPIHLMATEEQEQRKTVYEGEIHKCPNCGEVLNSFALTCPACGYEIRGNKSSDSVQKFALRLSQLSDESQKIMLIRSFPIPNTKEDIVEFIILASTNIQSKIDNELSDAWQVKFEQAYQKASMLFKNENEFNKIQEIYIGTTKKLTKLRQVSKMKKAGTIVSEISPVLPNVIIITIWLLSIYVLIPICGINLVQSGSNSAPSILLLLYIGGIFLIPPFTRCESGLPRLATTLGLILSILLIVLTCIRYSNYDGADAYGFLAMPFICSIILLKKMAKKKYATEVKPDKTSVMVALMMIGSFFVVFLISSLFVSIGNHTSAVIAKAARDEIFEWPEKGLATQIPKPEGTKGEITFNDDEQFWIEVKGYSVNEYEAYIEECKSKGFTIDSSKSRIGYEAYNKEGYHLDLLHMDSDNELDIKVQAPRAVGKLEWPTMGLALLVPTPNAEHGEVAIDTHMQLLVYVGDTSKEEYRAYVDSCIEKGFIVDYRRDDTIYDADDKDGNALWVEYEGNNIMRISLRSPND